MDERIESYCQLFEKIQKRVSKTYSENCREIALRIFEEIAKDLRSEQINKSRSKDKADENKENDDVSATKKQREALQKFGVKKVPENLTVREASGILNKLINLSKEKERVALEKAVEELNRNWV